MEEPSVLDLLKEKLNPRNWSKKTAPVDVQVPPPLPEKREDLPARKPLAFPWRLLLSVFFALIAQRMLEPQVRNVTGALFLYAAALGLLILGIMKKDWLVPELDLAETSAMDLSFRKVPFLACLPFMLLTFLTMSHNLFTTLNVVIWFITIGLALAAFWKPRSDGQFRDGVHKVVSYIRKPFLNIRLDGWNLLVIAVFAVGAFFHLYKLSAVPLEMTSDHAEKLLDIQNLFNGQYSIFMPNNAGREVIQFYISAALIKWFGAGINFTTLKLSMAIAFLVGLIFVYKLGKELGNRWTGLLAMLFMGMAQWTNIIARVGLRLVLCPVFVAPVMYYLIKGLRTSNRNQVVVAGVLLGLGLSGYSAFRIMPLVVVVGVLIYLLHQKTKGNRKQAWWALGVVTIFALILALPLIRYAWEYPTEIALRTVTRMTSAEVPLDNNVVKVFFSNCWNALSMPFWKDGSTWFISVSDRPGLDVVTAAFYFIGLIITIIRWIKHRTWQDMFLIVSIPLLMLPSILALAFPNENPSPSRLGGAIVPIIMIAAIGFQSLFASLWQKCRQGFGKGVVTVFALSLVFFSARQNYDIVFNQYRISYANATWNSKAIGEICRDFIDSVGTPETCYVSGLGHWVDTRLVAMVAGYPDKDFALWPDHYQDSLSNPNAKIFIVKADNTEDLAKLRALYPEGFITLHTSTVQGRDFIVFFIPPSGN
jgi:hypothetical protein